MSDNMKKYFNLARYNYYLTYAFSSLYFKALPKDKDFIVFDAEGKGSGLKSKKSYKKGELVFVAKGPVRWAFFEGDDCYKYPDWYMADYGTWIDIQKPYVKINHSCKPNLGIAFGRCFVALKNIESGTELSFDYSLTDDEDEWIMARSSCLCGEAECRGQVRAIQFIEEKYFNHSYPYISKYFVDFYKSKKGLSTDS